MEDEKNKNGGNNKNFNKNSYYNRDNREIKYIFEANFDKIKNIEVEPGLIKFINGNNDYNILNNSNINNSHIVNLILKQKNNIENYDYKKKNIEKSVNFTINKDKDKDIHNYMVQEEKSSEEQENKSKTSNNEAKKMKKIKIINFRQNSNDKTKNNYLQEHISKTVNKENLNKLPKFNRYPIRQTSLRTKVNILNNKNTINIPKNILNITNNDGKRYKTLDEVFHEIKVQENKFNSDSYIGYSTSLIKGLKSIKQERKDIQKLLGESEKKDLSLAFHKNYLSILAKRKKDFNNRSKSYK